MIRREKGTAAASFEAAAVCAFSEQLDDYRFGA
jgi:hypothetical protein